MQHLLQNKAARELVRHPREAGNTTANRSKPWPVGSSEGLLASPNQLPDPLPPPSRASAARQQEQQLVRTPPSQPAEGRATSGASHEERQLPPNDDGVYVTHPAKVVASIVLLLLVGICCALGALGPLEERDERQPWEARDAFEVGQSRAEWQKQPTQWVESEWRPLPPQPPRAGPTGTH